MYLYTGAVDSSRSPSNLLGKSSNLAHGDNYKELLEDEDLRMYPNLFRYANHPTLNANIFYILAEKYDGPFYWERSPRTMYDKIKIPVYCESNRWAYAHMHLVEAFWNYLGIDAPKKLQIGPL
ncbi:MAG: hypothetical protein ACREBS_11530 [Nitrososphaerales archaeon]